MPVCRCAGVPVCRCAGVPVCRCAGVSVCRCVGVSVCRCVGVSVCPCVTLMTRRHVRRKLLAGRLGTSNSKFFRRPLLLPSCCCGCVLNCRRFLCVGKILKSCPSQISSIVQGKLCSISKLLCRSVYNLSFILKINCTALPCLFFVVSFRCCCVEIPRRYRSCLLAPCV